MGWLPQLGGFGFFVLTFRISLLSHSFFFHLLPAPLYSSYSLVGGGGRWGHWNGTGTLEVHSQCNRQLLFLAGRGDWALLHIEGVSQTRIRIGKIKKAGEMAIKNVFNLTLAMSLPLAKSPEKKLK